MIYNDHSKLKGLHAVMGASKYHWIRYSDDKFAESYLNQLAVARGTKLHEYAAMSIELGQKMPRTHQTLNMYINDAIGYGMTPEQVLYYSPNCFGTADAISFKGNLLRIHDLKTGVTPAHMEQLEIYAALFCLEYHKKPDEIEMELRIYQNNDIDILNPTPDDINLVMDRIITCDKIIQSINMKEGM